MISQVALLSYQQSKSASSQQWKTHLVIIVVL